MLKFGRNSCFIFLISIVIVTNLVIFLDIPVLRLLFSFVFLTFIPGFFLLTLLKLNRLGLVEKLVLSVGLSVTFLMLFGLLVNSLLPAIGYTKPLSIHSLLISFSTATIVLLIIAYVSNKDITFSFSNFKLTTREKAFLIVPSSFPLLSMIGMHLMNLTDNNALLMVFLFMIPAYVIFISFSNRKVPENVYPPIVFLISISLLLMFSLRSNHLIDGDTHRELFMFLTILDNLRWSQLGFGVLDSCLSISMLPAIYQTLLNIDPEYLFKLLFSLMASILPLVVYLLAKKYLGSFYAFLASVFFMSQIVFLWTPTYTRATLATLFFALAIWVLFHDGISELNRRALFIVFLTSTIFSHYGVTWATFFLLLLTWIGVAALRLARIRLRKALTINILALFLVLLFFWYSQMTGPAFSSGVRLVYFSFTRFEWFLAEGASSPAVQAAFGTVAPHTGVPQIIEIVFSWLTIIFIATGILITMRRFKAMVFPPQAGHRKPDFLLKKFDAEYLMLSIVCCILLVTSVILPFLSKYYGASRIYFQMMVPLSIFFVTGGTMVSRYLKSRPYWVILVVLIPYFLCTTGMMTQVFGFPRAITLNSEGPLYHMYIHDTESYAAKWIGKYRKEEIQIFGTGHVKSILLSQGRIHLSQTSDPISSYEKGEEIDGYIYLRYSDPSDGGLIVKYPGMFAEKSKIYTNGSSEIYK